MSRHRSRLHAAIGAALVALLLASPPTLVVLHAAITFVAGDAGSPATDNPATAARNTTGASLIVCVVIHDLSSITMSDSATNTWTEVTATDIVSPARIVRVFYVLAPTTSATHTFTASGGSVFGSIGCLAFAGTATASALDQQVTGQSGSTPYAVGSITPTEAGEVVVSLAVKPLNVTSVSGGFTLHDQTNETGSGFGNGVAYLIQSSAAAANPSWTQSSSDFIGLTNLSFKATGGAPSTAPRLMLLGVG